MYEEKDPAVVSALMWFWLDSLREPILHAQDMPDMLSKSHVATALSGLDKVSKQHIVLLAMILYECVLTGTGLLFF